MENNETDLNELTKEIPPSNNNPKNNKGDAKGHILLAFILKIVFVVFEAVGGLITNSVAIISDSIHNFGDCIAVGSAYILEKISHKKPNKNFTFGYKRFSILSSLITLAIMLVGIALVIYSAIQRIIAPEEVDALGMVVIAIIGVTINGLAAVRTAKSDNLNEKSINLHLLEDVLAWSTVLISSIFILIFDIHWLDPILSIGVALYILYNVIRSLITAFNIILEKVPKDFDIEKFRLYLLEIPTVEKVNHLHLWTLDGEQIICTMHIVVNDNLNFSKLPELKKQVIAVCKSQNVNHTTVQIDTLKESSEYEVCDNEQSPTQADTYSTIKNE